MPYLLSADPRRENWKCVDASGASSPKYHESAKQANSYAQVK